MFTTARGNVKNNFHVSVVGTPCINLHWHYCFRDIVFQQTEFSDIEGYYCRQLIIMLCCVIRRVLYKYLGLVFLYY